ncbi:MAG: HK97 family phage prohead protease, partial [Sphingomonadaceae bacterium]
GALRFAGYAAIFDWPDRGGDIVRRGAFARSLGRGGAGVPLLWQHDRARPIGRIEYLQEDRRGLRVIGRLSAGRDGRGAAALLKGGAVKGLSFGYRVRGNAARPRAGRTVEALPLRELNELDLVEVSLVALPLQPRARVHMVESGGAAQRIR